MFQGVAIFSQRGVFCKGGYLWPACKSLLLCREESKQVAPWKRANNQLKSNRQTALVQHVTDSNSHRQPSASFALIAALTTLFTSSPTTSPENLLVFHPYQVSLLCLVLHIHRHLHHHQPASQPTNEQWQSTNKQQIMIQIVYSTLSVDYCKIMINLSGGAVSDEGDSHSIAFPSTRHHHRHCTIALPRAHFLTAHWHLS